MSLMYDALRAGSTDSASLPAKNHSSANLPARSDPTRTKLILGCVAGLLLGGAVTGVVMRGVKVDETTATVKVPLITAAPSEKPLGGNVAAVNAVNTVNTVSAVSPAGPMNPVAAVNAAGIVSAPDRQEPVSQPQASVALAAPAAPAALTAPVALVVPAVPVVPVVVARAQPEPDLKAAPALPVPRSVAIPAVPQPTQATAAVASNVTLSIVSTAGNEKKAASRSGVAPLPKTAELALVTPTVPAQPTAIQTAVVKPVVASSTQEVPPLASKVVNQAASPLLPADNTMSLPDRFEAMNKALGKAEKSDASVHLKAIQSALPANSIARLRAEGWHELQTGNIETAKTTYRKILERLPADDQAKAALLAIDVQHIPAAVPR